MSNKARWRNFSEEEIRKIVSESISIREVAKKLGYAPDGGGTAKSLKAMFVELNIDTSHFKGQGWNKENYDYDSFREGTVKKNGKTTLNPLIHLRGRKCENCGLEEWLGQPINLEIHHIDGDRLNNDLSNLILLCPNCHSYTSNFRKNSKQKRKVSDEDFIRGLKISSSIHQTLLHLGLTPSAGNYTRARELMAKNNISFN